MNTLIIGVTKSEALIQKKSLIGQELFINLAKELSPFLTEWRTVDMFGYLPLVTSDQSL